MIEQCLRPSPDRRSASSASCGCPTRSSSRSAARARSSSVLERMDDGRLNILARGTRPFRLLERQDDLPYPAGVVEFLDERGRGARRARPRPSARELYRELVEQATDRELERRRAGRAGRLRDGRRRSSSSMDAKQELLELRSENARLRLLGDAAARRDQAPGADRARAGARAAPTARSASAERCSAADAGTSALLGSGRRCWAVCRTNSASWRRTCGWPAELSLKPTDAVFVAHAVAEHRAGPRRERGVLGGGSCRSSWIARASTSCGSLSLSLRPPRWRRRCSCTPPSSLTSSVSFALAPLPLRCTMNRSARRDPAAAGQRAPPRQQTERDAARRAAIARCRADSRAHRHAAAARVAGAGQRAVAARRTACTPPKNRFSAPKRTTWARSRRARRASMPGSA